MEDKEFVADQSRQGQGRETLGEQLKRPVVIIKPSALVWSHACIGLYEYC